MRTGENCEFRCGTDNAFDLVLPLTVVGGDSVLAKFRWRVGVMTGDPNRVQKPVESVECVGVGWGGADLGLENDVASPEP